MNETTAAREIERLLLYAKKVGILDPENEMMSKLDSILIRNQLMELMAIDKPFEGDPEVLEEGSLDEILENLLDEAVQKGLIENNIVQKDLFDTKIMGLLTPAPSRVARRFFEAEEKDGIKAATDRFYKLNKDVNYIRMNRIMKNKHWITETEYGQIEITINLSKPEKDPLVLKKALSVPSTGYPKCVLCIENMGFQGSLKKAARQNHRMIPLELCDENWYFQYSPYVYYNEHCIIIYQRHKPMHICKKTFERLFQFLDRFEHYFIGSNTDLPIVGGSILEHEHYQGGRYEMPMVKAQIESAFYSETEGVEMGILHWPLSSIRLTSSDKGKLIELSDKILNRWRTYSDERVGILHKTVQGKTITPHNTITPIARINSNGYYEIDLVLRNNRTTDELPRGIFHPHPDLHHIKKENIGLIEVMGLAILPGRLEAEINLITDYLTDVRNFEEIKALSESDELYKHKEWILELKESCISGDRERITKEIKRSVGVKFKRVLEDAGVFKKDLKGIEAFHRFMNNCGFTKSSR